MKTTKIKDGKSATVVCEKAESQKMVLGCGSTVDFVLLATEETAGPALIEFELDGQGSEVRLLGFVIGKGNNNFDLKMVARHRGRGSKSSFSMRSAMFERSALNCKGNLRIEKGATGSCAHLQSRTLLLSPDARANSLPALEILAGDVKAGHAATTGKIDGESLFYLRSRGLDEDSARRTMIEAFFVTQINMVGDEEVRVYLSQKIAKLIPSHV
jgi:Fe-S cluster assembly protein SufD